LKPKPETRNSKLIITFVAALLLIVIVPVRAQFSGNIDVSFKANTDTLTVGDPITLTLKAVYPAGYTLTIPKLPQNWGDFEVRDQSNTQISANANGTQTAVQTIGATLFQTGAFQTPNWAITFTDAAGKTTERAVPQISLTVTSVLTQSDTALRDIKPQAELPVPPLWPWILIGLAGAILVGWGLWWLLHWIQAHRHPRPEAAATPIVDPRPAHQIALEELARIERLDLPGQGRFKEHYTLVTDCLRRYLEDRYHVLALERTTTEIKLALRHADLPRDTARQFLALFTASDMVKFARFVPTAGDARTLIPQARELVEKSKALSIVQRQS